MCGIAGVVGNGSLQLVQSMLAIQAHRGPDNTSVWQQEKIVLGHNRLSILDLSESANQPMHSSGHRYYIVFNGEIYNYKELQQQYLASEKLHTTSDTEVLLALYEKMGVQMLRHLIGMFAFAIWDSELQQLTVARDRFGVKPFYYSKLNDTWLFASEIKSLWAGGVTKQPNEFVWSSFFATGSYGMPNESFWQGVQSLPAGHFGIFEANKEPVIKQWYDFVLEIEEKKNDRSLLSILDEYSSLMNDAVKLRFRSDVPVGFNISGGLDSSTLLHAVHHNFPDNDEISAFTFYCNDDRYDELPWVKDLIAQTGKKLHPVLLSESDIPTLALEMALQQDEPYGGIPTIAYSQIFKAARSMGIYVLLDGQGMDEAWGGYDYYYKAEANIIQGISHSPVLPQALQPEFSNLAAISNLPEPFDNRLQNLQYRDIFYTKIPRALRFNDRASMMYSTELREPFLDHRLLELAFALPAQFKYHEGQTKYGLRQLGLRNISSNLALAPKRPLQTPQREWLRGPLRTWVADHLQTLTNSLDNGWFNKSAVDRGWQYYLNEQTDNSFYIWQWINAAMLLQKA